jgi:hypothetical protein
MGRIQLANSAQAASCANREVRIDRPGRHHVPAYLSRRSRNGLRHTHGAPQPQKPTTGQTPPQPREPVPRQKSQQPSKPKG